MPENLQNVALSAVSYHLCNYIARVVCGDPVKSANLAGDLKAGKE